VRELRIAEPTFAVHAEGDHERRHPARLTV
jgi:hypothetical protein